jgi:hypothetical protein
MGSEHRSLVGSDVAGGARATLGASSGAIYWEIEPSGGGESGASAVGVATASWNLDSPLGSASGTSVGLDSMGAIRIDGEVTTHACPFGNGDTIGIALDVERSEVYFSRRGVWLAGGDPILRVGGIPISVAFGEELFPSASVALGERLTANFGQWRFDFAPPPGFAPLFR